jgi:hypothetical protein
MEKISLKESIQIKNLLKLCDTANLGLGRFLIFSFSVFSNDSFSHFVLVVESSCFSNSIIKLSGACEK